MASGYSMKSTIFRDSDFVYTPPPQLSWARRVLIKPCAGYPLPYPVTTSPEILNTIIDGIRKVSNADILIADGTPTGESIYPVYKTLGYNFHHVLMLDIRDSIFVEVENPLYQFFAVESFWVPNVVLRSDFLISVTNATYSVRKILRHGKVILCVSNVSRKLLVPAILRKSAMHCTGWCVTKELHIAMP